MKKTFKNDAKPKELNKDWDGPGSYKFDETPILLFVWSRLFQSVISQAGTYLLTSKFHENECGIYKCEGGCRIVGVNELVLSRDHCYWDFGTSKKDKTIKQMADLITHVVLNWDPMNPVDSMIDAASCFIKCLPTELRSAVEKSTCGDVFGGNALANFFNWNPFSDPPIDRDYLRYCLMTFNGKTKKEVNQQFADENLGKKLKKKLNEHIRKSAGDRYVSTVMCCSPRRLEDGSLQFWVNTGRPTQIDYWQTEESLREFLKSDGKLIENKPKS